MDLDRVEEAVRAGRLLKLSSYKTADEILSQQTPAEKHAAELFQILEDFEMWVDDDHESVMAGIQARVTALCRVIRNA